MPYLSSRFYLSGTLTILFSGNLWAAESHPNWNYSGGITLIYQHVTPLKSTATLSSDLNLNYFLNHKVQFFAHIEGATQFIKSFTSHLQSNILKTQCITKINDNYPIPFGH